MNGPVSRMSRMGTLRVICTAAALTTLAGDVHAQTQCRALLGHADFAGGSADLMRTADALSDSSRYSFMIRRVSDRYAIDVCGAPESVRRLARELSLDSLPPRGAALLPADARISFNSGYARDWNDGALWSGGGASSSLSGGAVLRWDMFEAAIAPVFIAQQNMTFETHTYPDATYSQWIHRWHGRFIDLPQRFGRDPDVRLSAGQSYARVNAAGLRAGISNENIAWGPARRNALLLSGTAPGFAHVFVESLRPIDVWLGDAEFQIFYGRLDESDYYDFDASNDHRALSGVIATLRPRGLDGLTLGGAQLHMQTWSSGTSAGDILIAPFTGLDPDSVGLPRDMRLFGLFMRWAAAPSGFEVYGEWARQDSWQQWVRLLNPLDAAQAYTLGAQQTVRRGDIAVRLSAEVSHLSDALAHRNVGRGIHTYYVSTAVTQGHTHRGQLLGAPIGPGSEAQFIGADVFWSHGRSSLSVERVRYDDDAYYAVWGQNHGPHGHDTEFSVRAGHLLTLAGFAVEAELGYSFRYSRSLLGLHHVNSADFPYREDTNIGLRLGGRWTPPSWSWTPGR